MHKSVIGFIGVGVILLLMSMMMTAVKGSTTAPRTDSFSVTTGGGETTAIIGTQELPWKGLTSSVETISSSQPTLDSLCVVSFPAMKLPCPVWMHRKPVS